jgi:GTPase SAR1 family protein
MDSKSAMTPGQTPGQAATAGLKKCFAKVVVIGDSGVGKTSLIQVFEHNKFNQ